MMQIGPDQAWLWVAVEPMHRQILGVYISRHRTMIVAESFLRSLIKIYGKYTLYSVAEHGIQKHYIIGIRA